MATGNRPMKTAGVSLQTVFTVNATKSPGSSSKPPTRPRSGRSHLNASLNRRSDATSSGSPISHLGKRRFDEVDLDEGDRSDRTEVREQLSQQTRASDHSNDSASFAVNDDEIMRERVQARGSNSSEDQRQVNRSPFMVPKHDATNAKSFHSRDLCVVKELIIDNQRKTAAILKEHKQEANTSSDSIMAKLNNLERIVAVNSEHLCDMLYILSKNDKKKKASEKDKKMDLELILLDILFSDEVIERIFEKCTMKTLGCFLERTRSDQIPRQSSLAFRSIMFSKPVGAPVSLFSSGVGKEHSIFRKEVVVSLIESVRGNVFNQFESNEVYLKGPTRAHLTPKSSTYSNSKSTQVDDKGDEENSDLKPDFPKWLKAGYITEKHIEHVRNSREVTQSESSGPRRSKNVHLQRSDISNEAVGRIFKKVINRIKNGRESGKNSFFSGSWVCFRRLVSTVVCKHCEGREPRVC